MTATAGHDPVRIALAHLARVAAANPHLHAMTALAEGALLRDAERLRARRARGEALGPLAGMVVAVKDAFDVAGLPTTANARLLADAPPATADSTAVARLRAADALVLGKANCWEMSVGGPSRCSPAPPAINPWSPGADPGGSSSGSAVAVASGMATASLGGDTGGSVRLPAAFCGLAGFKPTHGLVPMHGAVPFAESLDVIGPLAATAAECAAIHAVLSAQPTHKPVPLAGLRIFVPQALLDHAPPAPAMAAAFAAALAALERAGAVVRTVALPSAALFNRCYFIIARSEAFARWRSVLAEQPHLLNALTRRSFAIGALIPPEAMADAARLRTILRAELAAAMAECDLLALPTAPDEAADLDTGDSFSRPDTAPYTRPFSLAGVPAISIPCGLGLRGRPLGLQLVGRHGADAFLLAAATATQAALPAIGQPKEWWR
jgi:aspartyl-tRNA(Asn)/glutamyl-tRNA(Gln) amidotransferase subunit A